MSRTEKKSSHPLIWRVLLILAAVCVAGVVLGLYGITIMNPAPLVVVCALLGALETFLFERRRAGEGFSLWRLARGLFTFVFASMLFAAAYLSVNILFPDEDTVTEVRTEVKRVYSETRHRSRRVGRRYVANGEEYKVFYMDVEYPGGYVKPRRIDFRTFRSTHPGDTLTVRLETGFFGVPFVTRGK